MQTRYAEACAGLARERKLSARAETGDALGNRLRRTAVRVEVVRAFSKLGLAIQYLNGLILANSLFR
jgi:hypothetical protein